MIKIIPKCPLCKRNDFTKKHVILYCDKITNERNEIINIFKKYGIYKMEKLLYLNTECDKTD